nr:unnamed protein product [Callosobruchus chinensis]
MADENNWRTPAFRQSVVAKIDEAIRSSGMNPSRNSLEMESHVFQKAKSKEEYLGFVARLILHVREMSKYGTVSIILYIPGCTDNQAPPRFVKRFPISQFFNAARNAEKDIHKSLYSGITQHD